MDLFNRKKLDKLQSEKKELLMKQSYLEKDFDTLFTWLSTEELDSFDMKLKNARINFINILTLLKIQKENEQLNNCINAELNYLDKIIKEEIEKKQIQLENLTSKIKQLEVQVIEFEDEILYQSFGMYTPVYNLMNSTEYKERIKLCRNKQKQMIKEKSAAICKTQWTVNDSVREGKKNDQSKH